MRAPVRKRESNLRHELVGILKRHLNRPWPILINILSYHNLLHFRINDFAVSFSTEESGFNSR
jgi:hypothetical protein